MKSIFCVIIVSVLAGLNSYATDSLKVKHVVVIGVDGLSSWSINRYNTPVLDSLMKEGSSTLKAKAVYPTLSCPNWASMIMGVKPKYHGIYTNHWTAKDREGKTNPTIFQMIRQQYPTAKIGVFNHWKEFTDMLEKGVVSKSVHIKSANATIKLAQEYIVNEKPEFTFVHLDHVDSSGHHYGHRSKEYKSAVIKTDSLVGALISYVNNSGLKGNVLFIVTSDHGFWGKHHGGFMRKEKNIPWIVVGPGVKVNYRVKSKINTCDTAATLAYLFSIKTPEYWIGKNVKEIFNFQK